MTKRIVEIMKMEFLTAKMEDHVEICKLFHAAVFDMQSRGIDQWDAIYPDANVIRDDISKGQMIRVCIDDKIVAVYVLNQECDEAYGNGQWSLNDNNFCVIHRLCVSPEYQNKGIARNTMQRIEKDARAMGLSHIRLDAFTKNPSALHLYESLSYVTVGTATWRKGVFLLMEKKII